MTMMTTETQMVNPMTHNDALMIINNWMDGGYIAQSTPEGIAQNTMIAARMISGMVCDEELAWAYGKIREIAGPQILWHVARLLPTLMQKSCKLFLASRHSKRLTRGAA